MPLVAVKYVSQSIKNRKYLASFVGAAEYRLYRSNIRKRILNQFNSSKNIIVYGNKEWFYHKIVYETNFTYEKNKSSVDKNDKYVKLLEQSLFGFCPSGTGQIQLDLGMYKFWCNSNNSKK